MWSGEMLDKSALKDLQTDLGYRYVLQLTTGCPTIFPNLGGALRKKDFNLAKSLVTQGTSPNTLFRGDYSDTTHTPLTYAICSELPDDSDFIPFLLEHGADPNKMYQRKSGERNGSYDYQYSPLYLAAEYNKLNTFKQLLDHGADVTKLGNHYKCSVDIATDTIISEESFKLTLRTSSDDIRRLFHNKLSPISLDEYIRNRTKDERSYKTTFFCQILKFGYSKQQKITAATLLKDVLAGNNPPEDLKDHIGPLTQGDLKKVWENCKVGYPELNLEELEQAKSFTILCRI
jgi:hypothetical protein